MSFANQVKKFAQQASADIDNTMRGVELKLMESLVKMSPVGNPDLWQGSPPPGYAGGRFRANWQFGNNKLPEGTLDKKDKSGGPTKDRLAAAIEQAVAGDVHYIVNNLPYAITLEYGHSTQASSGMVRVTVARFKSIVSQVARTIK